MSRNPNALRSRSKRCPNTPPEQRAVGAALASIALEVRPANEGARALYERFGLREVGRLLGYYPDTGDDAVLMLSPPLDDPAFRERIGGLRAALAGEAGVREVEERAGSSERGGEGGERR